MAQAVLGTEVRKGILKCCDNGKHGEPEQMTATGIQRRGRALSNCFQRTCCPQKQHTHPAHRKPRLKGQGEKSRHQGGRKMERGDSCGPAALLSWHTGPFPPQRLPLCSPGNLSHHKMAPGEEGGGLRLLRVGTEGWHSGGSAGWGCSQGDLQGCGLSEGGQRGAGGGPDSLG